MESPSLSMRDKRPWQSAADRDSRRIPPCHEVRSERDGASNCSQDLMSHKWKSVENANQRSLEDNHWLQKFLNRLCRNVIDVWPRYTLRTHSEVDLPILLIESADGMSSLGFALQHKGHENAIRQYSTTGRISQFTAEFTHRNKRTELVLLMTTSKPNPYPSI